MSAVQGESVEMRKFIEIRGVPTIGSIKFLQGFLPVEGPLFLKLLDIL
jgi:hypothetical protein